MRRSKKRRHEKGALLGRLDHLSAVACAISSCSTY